MSSATGENPVLRELTQFREHVQTPAVFGGVLGASGELILHAIGEKRRGFPDAVDASDLVHIGSCNKMLTACLFGTFVSENRTTWDMPVAELFPDLQGAMADGWQRTTVAELLYCLSGMAANPPRRILRSGYADPRPLAEQRTELAGLAFSQPPKAPGRFRYSNLSYIVIGAAIDRLTGESYEAALGSRLLEPLGVTSAAFGPPPDVWGHAPRITLSGLGLFKGKPAPPDQPESDNPPVLSSAGTLHLSCADWARLLGVFLRDNDTSEIEPAIVERILQLPQSKAGRMTMGWAPAELPGASLGAQGSNLRWSATALLDEQRRRVGFAVCNDGRTSVLRRSVFLVQRLLQQAD